MTGLVSGARHHDVPDRAFLRLVLGVFVLVALLRYLPILTGKVPFPADIVNTMPPWESVAVSRGRGHHAELGDLVTMMYPWRVFAAEAVRHFALPLWNHHILLGAPFLANGVSAVFYPVNYLYYVLPISAAWGLRFALNTLIAGTSMALFVRSIGGSISGAIGAGVIFACSGYVTAWQGWPHVDTAIWLPLMLFSVHRLFRNPSWRSSLLVSGAFAMPVFGGHPETAVYVILAGTGFALARLLQAGLANLKDARRCLLFFAAGGILAVGLASAQWIPTVTWIRDIGRMEISWGTATTDQILGLVSRDARANPNSAGISLPESASYVGILTLLLVALSPFHRNKWDAAFFSLLAIISLQGIFGWEPSHWVLTHFPVIKALKHWRLWLLVDFSLAVLAGLGISALQQEMNKPALGRRLLWCLGPALAAVIVAVGLALLPPRGRLPEHPATSAFLLFVGVLLIGAQVLVKDRRRRLFSAMMIVLFADLMTFCLGYIPFARPRDIFPRAPLFDFLQKEDPSTFRVAALDLTYGPNFEIVYGLTAASGYENTLRQTRQLMRDFGDDGASISFASQKVTSIHDRRLDLMNVKYLAATSANDSFERMRAQPERFNLVFSDGSARIFQNKSVLPRAFLVPAAGIERIPTENEQAARLREERFDPERTVLLYSQPSRFEGIQQSAPAGPAEVLRMEQGMNRFMVEARANAASILVLSQTHYKGWTVTVDGQNASLLRVDHSLCGVALNPGVHKVAFVFQPLNVRLGIFISLTSLVLIVGIAVAGRRAQRSTTFLPA